MVMVSLYNTPDFEKMINKAKTSILIDQFLSYKMYVHFSTDELIRTFIK